MERTISGNVGRRRERMKRQTANEKENAMERDEKKIREGKRVRVELRCLLMCANGACLSCRLVGR